MEFKQALSYMEINPLIAKAEFETYLEKYPEDYSAYPYYASLLITLQQLPEAEKILNFIKITATQDKQYTNNFNKINNLKKSIFFTQLKLLAYQEKYDEVYQLYLTHLQEAKILNIQHILFYCKKKLGKLNNYQRNDIDSYLRKQIIEYKESDFLEHIQKHLTTKEENYNKNITETSDSIFIANFPINEVIKEIKKYIPSDKRLYPGFFQDLYIFKYNGCGRDRNKVVDYFKVICFHNTMNFITMLPTSQVQDLPYIDLNYLINISQNSKTKRLSQIEKFNKKYNHNTSK